MLNRGCGGAQQPQAHQLAVRTDRAELAVIWLHSYLKKAFPDNERGYKPSERVQLFSVLEEAFPDKERGDKPSERVHIISLLKKAFPDKRGDKPSEKVNNTLLRMEEA